MVAHGHRAHLCPDCGRVFTTPGPAVAPGSRSALVGPHGLAVDGAPLLRRAAAAQERERLMGPTVKDRQANPKLVTGTCPRCLSDFWTMPKYGHDLCKCGWLLKIEPLFGALSVDDVVQVFDPTGLVMRRHGGEEKERLREGVRRIYENWLARGILKRMEVSLEDGKRKVGLTLPTGQYLWDEEEDRKRAGGT